MAAAMRCLFFLSLLAQLTALMIALELVFLASLRASSSNCSNNNGGNSTNSSTFEVEEAGEDETQPDCLQARPFIVLSAVLLLLQVMANCVIARRTKRRLEDDDEATTFLAHSSNYWTEYRVSTMILFVSSMFLSQIGMAIRKEVSMELSTVVVTMIVCGNILLLLSGGALLFSYVITLSTNNNEQHNDELREPLLSSDRDIEVANGNRQENCRTAPITTPTPTARTITPSSVSSLQSTPTGSRASTPRTTNSRNATSPASSKPTRRAHPSPLSVATSPTTLASAPSPRPTPRSTTSEASTKSQNGVNVSPRAAASASIASPRMKTTVLNGASQSMKRSPTATSPTATPSPRTTATTATTTATTSHTFPAASPLHEKTWLARFAELKAFQQEHGHTDVPAHYYKSPQLHRWCERQRVQYQAFKKVNERSTIKCIVLIWVLYIGDI
jgi:hypothetical protein